MHQIVIMFIIEKEELIQKDMCVEVAMGKLQLKSIDRF